MTIKKILLNKEIVQKLKNFGLSYRKISKIFKCCRKTIWNWINKEIIGPKNKCGRKKKITQEITSKVLEFVNNKVMVSQYEIQEFIEKLSSLKVHQSTISRFLKSNDITKKRITKRYSEKRDITGWVNEFKNIDKSNLMSLDESAFMMNECPRYGYSIKNTRAIVSEPGQKGKRYTLLLCVSNSKENSYVNHMLFDGSLKTDRFCEFISSLDKNGIMILDNASCHRSNKVKEMIKEKSIKFHYLPPYQPEMNPTEHCFSVIKNYVRNKRPRTFENLKTYIEEAIEILCSNNKVYNMFNHCLIKN